MSIWKGLKKVIGTAAPLLGGVVAGPFGGVGVELLAKAFGVEATPEEVEKAIRLDPDAMAKIKLVEAENKGELETLYQQTVMVEVQEHHKTARAAIMSDDPFVRRQRPFFGYIIAICFALQFLLYLLAGMWTVIFDPENTGVVFNGMAALAGSLTTIWAIALSVQGYNITSRSRDKQVAAGQEPPPSIIGGIMQRFVKGSANG